MDNYAGSAGSFTLKVHDHIGNDLKTSAEELMYAAQWCSTDQYYSNTEATNMFLNSESCPSYQPNVWFKFKATGTKATIKLLYTLFTFEECLRKLENRVQASYTEAGASMPMNTDC